MQSKVLELLRPALSEIAPTMTVSGGMNKETRGAGGSGVEKKLTIAVEQEEDTLMSTVLMVLLQHRKFQAPGLITDILRGRHCFLIEMVSWRIHFTRI